MQTQYTELSKKRVMRGYTMGIIIEYWFAATTPGLNPPKPLYSRGGSPPDPFSGEGLEEEGLPRLKRRPTLHTHRAPPPLRSDESENGCRFSSGNTSKTLLPLSQVGAN